MIESLRAHVERLSGKVTELSSALLRTRTFIGG